MVHNNSLQYEIIYPYDPLKLYSIQTSNHSYCILQADFMVSRIGYTKEVVIESDLNNEYEPVCTFFLEFYFIYD